VLRLWCLCPTIYCSAVLLLRIIDRIFGPVPFPAEYLICRHVQTDRQTDRQRDRETDRQTDRQTDRKTDRQTDRQTDGWTDGRTNSSRLGWVTSINRFLQEHSLHVGWRNRISDSRFTWIHDFKQ
jgi:hypothetical protein